MYIRESRRIQAKRTELEQHVGTDARMQATGKNKDEGTAQPFIDGANQTDPPFRFSNSIFQSNQRLREVKRNRRFSFGLPAQGVEIQRPKLTAR